MFSYQIDVNIKIALNIYGIFDDNVSQQATFPEWK